MQDSVRLINSFQPLIRNSKIRSAKSDLKANGKLEELTHWADDVLAKYPEDPKSIALTQEIRNHQQNEVYQCPRDMKSNEVSFFR